MKGAAVLLPGVCFVLVIFLGGGFLYYYRLWRRFDRILQKLALDGDAGISDVEDTRESKLVSQLKRILSSAAFKERMARQEKDQITGLLADISHQLKTPLANIVMNMEILENGSLDEAERREFVVRSGQQAKKLQWLMQTLVKASRLENGMVEFSGEMQGLKQTLAASVSAVYMQAAEKDIRVETREFQDFFVYHNRKWTAEALGNILENGIKYSPRGSVILISVERLEIYTRIDISDRGRGIPPEQYNEIFKRFYRGKDVSEIEGSGLGLYISGLILKQELGYVQVSSEQGKGSCFSVFLLNAPPRMTGKD